QKLCSACRLIAWLLSSWQCHTALTLVFTAAVFITGLTNVVRIALKKQHLCHALARINTRRQVGGITKFQRHMPFPLRLKWGDVDDDTAACIGRFTKTNRQYITRNTKILHRARQSKRVWRNDTLVTDDINEAFFIEVFWVYNH